VLALSQYRVNGGTAHVQASGLTDDQGRLRLHLGGEAGVADLRFRPAIFVSLLALATFTFVTVQFGIVPLPKGLQFTPQQVQNFNSTMAPQTIGSAIWIGVAITVAYLAIYILFAVAWHRHFLLHSGSTSVSELLI